MAKQDDILKRRVRDIKLKKNMTAAELLSQMKEMGGFSGAHMAEGTEIMRAMLSDNDSFNFLSFPADIVSTGLRGVLAGMVKHFDAIITTGGMFDHDIARAFGGVYSIGTFNADDNFLHKKKIYRLGNVFIGQDEYGLKVEEATTKILKEIFSQDRKEFSPSDLAREFGKRITDEGSILRQAYLNNVPIYCPGIFDGAFGTQITLFAQDHDIKINLIKDELALSNLSFDEKVTGALMIGGGISKHHVIWWNQFKGGLDYAVYITTASQYDGSLSGARLTEAVSWGKIKEQAKYTTIDGDATIILPFMMAALDVV